MARGYRAVKKQSLIKNYIYQFLYQGLIIIIPFILSPYLTRTLRETALGTYTYVKSIAYYFVVAANLGIGIHGKRLIARNAKDEEKLRRSFWSLFAIHAIIALIAIMAYFGFVFCFTGDDRLIYLIEAFYVASALFDITWLFYGLENFKSVVIKNTAVKVVSCILIFLLVKSPKDLWIYTMISAGSLFAGQAVMLPQAARIIKPIRVSFRDMTQHIKPMLIFAITIAASSLYTVFDKTLLGIMTNKENVSFYEYANQIVTLPRMLAEIVSSVMFPRACRLAAEGRRKEQNRYIEYSFFATAFIGSGAFFGLLAVARPFAVWYYGRSFAVCGPVMIALSPVAYIVGSGNILRSQCLIPNGRDKEFNACIILNAIVNLIVSTSLIPILGIYGAVLGTICAELCGFIVQAWLCRNMIDVRIIPKTLIPFIMIGSLMYGGICLAAGFLPGGLIGLAGKVMTGGLIYIALTGIYLWLFERDIAEVLIGKVRRKSSRI